MTVKITVELPDELARRARDAATLARRPFEDMLVDWIERAASESSVEALPDDQLLTLCGAEMDAKQQQELGTLLAAQREGKLSNVDRGQLDDLMKIYRRGLVRKAQALQVAVKRGLKSPLG
jgi:hypothetical protein